MSFSPLIVITTVAALFSSVYLYFLLQDPSASLNLPFLPQTPDPIHQFSLHTPHTSSWTSWLHPYRHHSHGSSKLQYTLPTGGGGKFSKDWNILYHLGGNGPWVEKVENVVHGGIAVPEGCSVDQVHMISRHSERFPTTKAGNTMLKTLNRIKDLKITLKGDLSFVNTWKFLSSDPQAQFESLTTTGPYAGTLGAFTTGVKLRSRYSHLLSRRLAPGGKTSFWASDSSRVIETARYFGAGFFGLAWKDTATLHIIPETGDEGANTLTPGNTCRRYYHDLQKGHDQGYFMRDSFSATYLPAIRERFLKQNPKIEFTDEEIFSMQGMCGFETTIRGSSLWCDVFTKEDWLNYEYARDVIHYYRAGPGTPYAAPMGWLWVNATANLLQEGPSAGPFFFSFMHDNDIAPILSTLDIFHDDKDLSITHRPQDYNWRMSQVLPMGARVILERMTCPSSKSKDSDATYVRINVNDGIVPLKGCDSGSGKSCPLNQFLDWTKTRGKEVGDFSDVCGLTAYEPDAPKSISFLHQ